MKPETKPWAILTRGFSRAARQVIRDTIGQLRTHEGTFGLVDIPASIPLDVWVDAWWTAAVQKHLEGPLLDLIRNQVRFTLADLGQTITAEIANAYVTAVAAAHIRQIESWAPDIGRTILGHIAEGTSAGESIPKIAKRLEQTVGSIDRATLIARTETIAATNGANMAAYRVSGVPIRKEWLATGDERTRETHRDANTQTVDRDQAFIVGGYAADYPGDPNLPIRERANCRCAVLPIRGEAGQDPLG